MCDVLERRIFPDKDNKLQKFYDRSPWVIVKHVTIGDKSGTLLTDYEGII